MDLFKQNLAPIPTAGWDEITDRATEVITSILSARKVLKVDGPLGLEKESLQTGRLKDIKEKGNVQSGVYDVKALLESRITFKLDRWELDNLLRGAEDVELEPLEKAAEELALFEEDVIFNGYKQAGIEGLVKKAAHTIKSSNETNDILEHIAEAVLKLQDAYASGPFYMVVSDEAYKILNQVHGGKLLIDLVKKIIGGEIIRSKVIKGALLLPYNNADLQMIIGQDYKIGYVDHDRKEVELFLMTSFTSRILDENLLVHFEF
ncbi:MAG: bacteriocin family protein [Candidatus Izimaplasma sp.]|nr:bacteriocin family protein [Candidatus Izimaplasma bacterium]